MKLVTVITMSILSLAASTSFAVLDSVSVSGMEYATVASSEKVWDKVIELGGEQIDSITKSSMKESQYLVQTSGCALTVEVLYKSGDYIPGQPGDYPTIKGVRVLEGFICQAN